MIAFVARDLRTGRCLASRERTRLPAFSTIKVLIAAAFWEAVAEGVLRETRVYAYQPWSGVGGSGVLRGFRHAAKLTLADCAHLMLAVSDNTATNIVLAFLGLARVNALAGRLGLADTVVQRAMMDEAAVREGRDNLTSAADLAALLEELAVGTRLGPAVTGPVWASLEAQEHLDGIPRYLPPAAVYAGKCGDDSPAGRYTHDCGLVREGERRVVMAIMTDGGEGYEAVSRLGAALYEALRDD